MRDDVAKKYAEATKEFMADCSNDYLEKINQRLEQVKKERVEMVDLLSFGMKWYNLREAVRLKGGNYGTVKNRQTLQPKGGIPDHHLHGVKVWSRETIREWVEITDEKRPAYLRQVLPQLNLKGVTS